MFQIDLLLYNQIQFIPNLNCRETPSGNYDGERENCELSDRDSRDLEIDNPQYFDTNGNFDFYERSESRQGIDGDCLDGKSLYNSKQ